MSANKTQMIVAELKARRDKAQKVVDAANQALALFGVVTGGTTSTNGSSAASERMKAAWRKRRAKAAAEKKAAAPRAAGAPLAEAAAD